MSHYETRPMDQRFAAIMRVISLYNDRHLTSAQICRHYLGSHYTTSDVGSTGQILNVLALAGIVEKIKVQKSAKMFSAAYRLK